MGGKYSTKKIDRINRINRMFRISFYKNILLMSENIIFESYPNIYDGREKIHGLDQG